MILGPSITMNSLLALSDTFRRRVAWLPARLGAFVGTVAFAATIALVAGQAAIAFGLAAIATLAVALRWPWVPLLITFALAGAFGSRGGHWKSPIADLPLFELLLAAGAVGSLVWLARAWPARSREGTILALIWIPAAAYALILVIFLNQRDLVAGAREAIILGYPLAAALPLATLPAERLRSFLEHRGWQLVFVFVVAAVITGLINLAIENTVPTSSGQPRSLSAEYTGPLAAGLLAAAWLAIYQRRYRVALALAALSGTGLLMVNSRSAYLGLLMALVLLVFIGPLPKALRANPGRAIRITVVAAAAIAVVLAVTPLGQDGVARFGALFNTSDGNYTFRERALKRAVTKENAGEVVFGKGVGLQPTNLDEEYISDLTEGTRTLRRLEPHNSLASIYQRAGAIGLVLTLVPIAFLVWAMVRARRQPAVAWMLTLTTFVFVMTLFNVVLENSYFGIWFWLPLCLGGVLGLAAEPAKSAAPAPFGAARTTSQSAKRPDLASTVDG